MAAAMAAAFLIKDAAPICAGSWTQFRRSESRTGFIQETAAPPLVLRWNFNIPGGVVSSPVVGYGRVYIGSRAGSVYALDAYTGDVVWEYSTSDWVDATPALADGRLFVPSRDGTLYALDAHTGDLLWSYNTGSADIASPAVLDSEVYATTGYPNKKLYVLDAQTGTFRREIALSQFSASSPVLDPANARVYAGANDGTYSGWTASLGSQWSTAVQTQGSINYATPALYGSLLFGSAGDDDRKIHAFNAATGAEVWVSTMLCTEASLATSVAASTNTVFLGAGSFPHKVFALSQSTGGVKWSVTLGDADRSALASSPAVANDLLYVLSPAGELYAIHTATGGVQARIPLGAQALSSPAIANGWVYAAAMDGKLYGFESQRAWAVAGPDQVLGRAEGIVVVTGTVISPNLTNYTIQYGSGTSPAAWTTVSQSTQSVSMGALGTWDVRDFPDGVYSLRLVVQESGAIPLINEANYSFTISQVATASVDPSTGVTVALADGTEVFVPAGAVAGVDTLTVRKLFSGYTDFGIPEGVEATPIVREFTMASSANPKFLKPVTLKMPYYQITPDNEDNLRIYYYDVPRAEWRIVNTSVVKKDERRIWAEVDHFTIFRVMQFAPSSNLLPSGDVYTYPNPARGDTVTFKFRLGDAADVRIKVFDVTGALVAELEKMNAPAGIASTITWDVGRKASGVYIYRLEAGTASGSSAHITKKLAIIH